jgi:putative transposase
MWRLSVMCRLLSVSKSGYFAWKHRPESDRTRTDRAITTQIKAIHTESRRTYGSPRVHQELVAQGVEIGKGRVERLMKTAGISVKPPRLFVTTTDSNHDDPIAEDLIQQHFSAEAQDRRWVTDITYVHTDEGWLFVSAIMDLFSRRIVGWAMGPTMHRSLVLKALDMAVTDRRPEPGLIHHSDRGSQYASLDYRTALKAQGMLPSMSRKACCYDNAAMESFWHTLKNELIHRRHFQTRSQAQQSIFEYIEVFYNRTRLHSAIGYLSPADFEFRRHKAA